MDVLFFIKLASQGGGKLQIRGARGVPAYVESPMRLDNFGKKCRVPFNFVSGIELNNIPL